MVATQAVSLPRHCAFSPTDWQVLAPFWHPVAFARDITPEKPYGTRRLDERFVIYRTSAGSVTVARDLDLHRGAPLREG